MPDRFVHNTIQPRWRNPPRRQQVPRPLCAHIPHPQRAAAIVEVQQARHSHAFDRQHDGTPAHPPRAIAMIVPRDHPFDPAAPRAGHIARFRIAVGKAQHAGRLRPGQMSQDLGRGEGSDHTEPSAQGAGIARQRLLRPQTTGQIVTLAIGGQQPSGCAELVQPQRRNHISGLSKFAELGPPSGNEELRETGGRWSQHLHSQRIVRLIAKTIVVGVPARPVPAIFHVSRISDCSGRTSGARRLNNPPVRIGNPPFH
jgi:hypothetical protein